MRRPWDKVELLNLPDYRQGTHDALCLYYSCAMMLAALYPDFEPRFGLGNRHRRKLVLNDPLISHFRDQVNKTADKSIASWFFDGADMVTATKVLNRVMKEKECSTQFDYVLKNRKSKTVRGFHDIASSIDVGLPVIIGWSTVDFGEHAVLVRGYEIGKDHHWLLLRDPGGEERISWEVLSGSLTTRLEVIQVRNHNHDGLRPDKLVYKGEVQRLKRWWFKDGEPDYFDAQELFEAARTHRENRGDEDDVRP